MKFKFLLLLVPIFCISFSISAQVQDPDFNFDLPLISPGDIRDIHVSNNKTYFAGFINFMDNERSSSLVRVNNNGSRDETFNYEAESSFIILGIDELASGDIAIWGGKTLQILDDLGTIILSIDSTSNISAVRGDAAGNIYYVVGGTKLYKLNSSYELDMTFNQNNEIEGFVADIELQDDNIILAGVIFKVNGIDQNSLARFDNDGNYDPTFDTGTGTFDFISNITVQPDNKILLGGAYINSFDGTSFSGIARLDVDGGVDLSFNPGINLNGPTSEIFVVNNKIIFGSFTSNEINEIVKFNLDGSLIETVPIKSEIRYLFVDESENVITSKGTDKNYPYGVFKTKSDNQVDTDFAPKLGTLASIYSLDNFGNELLISGNFISVGSELRTNGLAMIKPNGELDTEFNPELETFPPTFERPVKYYDTENIYVADGEKILKLNRDGDKDPGFNLDGLVPNFYNDILLLDDGSLMVFGVNGLSKSNPDGSEDMSFNKPLFSGSGGRPSLTKQGDKVVVQMAFDDVNGEGYRDIMRIDLDGNIDLTFNKGNGGRFVDVVKVLPNGKIGIGGSIDIFNNHPVNKFALLDEDGVVDKIISDEISVHTANSFRINNTDIFRNGFLLYGRDGDTGIDLFLVDQDGEKNTSFSVTSEKSDVISSTYFHPVSITDNSFFVAQRYAQLPQGDFKFVQRFIYNDKPTVTGLTDPIQSNEDEIIPLDVEDFIIDDQWNNYPDDFSLTISESDEYEIVEDGIVPKENFNGELQVEVTVSDGMEESDSFTFTVEVLPVNDAPVITDTESQSSLEDESFTIELTSLTVEDPDNSFPDDFTLFIEDGDNYSVEGNEILPIFNFFGELGVNIKVNDGMDDSEPFLYTVIVEPVNDEPVITGFPMDLTMRSDESLTFTIDQLVVEDPDHTFPEDHTLIVLAGDNYVVEDNSITPINMEDTISVKVVVNDGIDESLPIFIHIGVDIVTGINSIDQNLDLEAYPNPAQDWLYILSDSPYDLSYIIKDANGRTVKQRKLGIDRAVDISGFEKGLYYLIVSDKLSAKTLTFFKQ